MGILLIFSHELTIEQMFDLKKNWHVDSFYPLPEELKYLWTNVPPELPTIKEFLTPIFDWIYENRSLAKYVLVQGDFGATYLVVNYSLKLHLIPLYATTKRMLQEKTMPDGSVEQKRIFKHCAFRVYGA